VLENETQGRGDSLRRFDFAWETGDAAMIKFEADKKGIATAWIPDDKFWHNRMVILGNRTLYDSILCYRKNGAVMDSETFKIELSCLERTLKHEVDVYNLYNEDKLIGKFSTENAAKEEISSRNSMTTRVLPNGELQVVPKDVKEYRIVKGKESVDKPEIVDLKKKYRRKFQFGWSECPEFDNIKNVVVTTYIREKEKLAPKSTEAINFVKAIESISDDEKKKIADLLMSYANKQPVIKEKMPNGITAKG
jgi:hypothetical protein